MKEVVIASACRTAIGAFGGTLRDTIAASIAASAMEAAWQPRRHESDEDAAERRRRTRLAIEATPRTEHPNVVAAAAPLARVMDDAPFELGLDVLIDGLAAKAGTGGTRVRGRAPQATA